MLSGKAVINKLKILYLEYKTMWCTNIQSAAVMIHGHGWWPQIDNYFGVIHILRNPGEVRGGGCQVNDHDDFDIILLNDQRKIDGFKRSKNLMWMYPRKFYTGTKMLDSACLDLAIGKPNIIIKTD